MTHEEWLSLVKPPEQLNEKEAKRVYRNYCAKLDRLTIKARHGDREAAHKVITTMTDMEIALHVLGFRTQDDKPRVVPITLEWVNELEANKTEMDRLTEKARHGDAEAVRQVILLMSQQN